MTSRSAPRGASRSGSCWRRASLQGLGIGLLLAGELTEDAVRRIQQLVADSGALHRVGGEARGLVQSAVRELEEVEMNGVAPLLAGIAEQAVDRVS